MPSSSETSMNSSNTFRRNSCCFCSRQNQRRHITSPTSDVIKDDDYSAVVMTIVAAITAPPQRSCKAAPDASLDKLLAHLEWLIHTIIFNHQPPRLVCPIWIDMVSSKVNKALCDSLESPSVINPETKPTDSHCESACRLVPLYPPMLFIISTQPKR